MAVGQHPVPLVNMKIGKWMCIHAEMAKACPGPLARCAFMAATTRCTAPASATTVQPPSVTTMPAAQKGGDPVPLVWWMAGRPQQVAQKCVMYHEK